MLQKYSKFKRRRNTGKWNLFEFEQFCRCHRLRIFTALTVIDIEPNWFSIELRVSIDHVKYCDSSWNPIKTLVKDELTIFASCRDSTLDDDAKQTAALKSVKRVLKHFSSGLIIYLTEWLHPSTSFLSYFLLCFSNSAFILDNRTRKKFRGLKMFLNLKYAWDIHFSKILLSLADQKCRGDSFFCIRPYFQSEIHFLHFLHIFQRLWVLWTFIASSSRA